MESNPAAFRITRARGIGPGRARILGRLGIETIGDALHYLPRRYEDRASTTPISALQEGAATVRGRITGIYGKRIRRGLNLTELVVSDPTGAASARWFNQPFLAKTFQVGREVFLSGPVRRNAGRGLVFEGPDFEMIGDKEDDLVHTSRVVPVYPLTEGISQKQFRRMMFGLVGDYADAVADPIPPGILQRYGLPALGPCLREVHFPGEGPAADISLDGGVFRRRLCFDELFMLSLGIAISRRGRSRKKGRPLTGDGRLRSRLLQLLPFSPTAAQKRVLEEIFSDMGRSLPMNRLIQGDVGCGKTLVALMAMLNAVEAGFQAALMAPTEVLAEQHYLNICRLAGRLGIRTALLSGGAGQRSMDEIASGRVGLVIGTHALIQEGVEFDSLGLAVIDEQHKFGVMQRGMLRRKGINPHMLVMTATPIPRSLALTIYGDLDCSVIDELPPSRRPVESRVLTEDRKAEVYDILDSTVRSGRQAYVVYPAIDESDAGLRAAVQGRRALQRKMSGCRIGLLHGRMPSAERATEMEAFKKGETDILVSTTVIEVGMDVPNATVMVIVHAERFGLSQLHQLRGRVGRGGGDGLCLLLVYGDPGEDAGRRLRIMEESSDGFVIAEEDLAIRGPGDLFGTRQAGIPDLRVADIARDREILEQAREASASLMEQDPDLASHPALMEALEVFWRGKIELFRAG